MKSALSVVAAASFLLLPALASTARAESGTAIFAGGCFWCVEKDFEHVPGVSEAVSGYTGGEKLNPTYRDHEGHVEAVRITFDPAVVTYRQLVDIFWRSVDPTDDGGQFCDRGESYKTAIFALDPVQQAEAEQSRAEAAAELGQTIVTPIRMAGEFWLAEDYHQDYYKKNPVRYNYYRWGCGRDQRVEALWGGEAHAGIDKE